jgi:hypothetical protein
MPFDFEQLGFLAESTRVSVLIWGSGKGYKEHFEKRTKIREELAKRFPHSSVHFCEDPSLLDELKKSLPHADDLTVPEQEFWHLGACDVCVALDTSEGVHEEIAHFVNSVWCYKLFILTSAKYKGSTGFPAMLRQNQNQIFYEDVEYESCHLVERVVGRVKHVALSKAFGLKA